MGFQDNDKEGTKKNIADAIDEIRGTAFGQTPEGQRIINELTEMNNAGRIVLADLGDNRAEYIEGLNATIIIDKKVSITEYPGRLVHEGTHHIDHLDGKPMRTFETERHAFDNAYQVDSELKLPDIKSLTDEEIRERYKFPLGGSAVPEKYDKPDNNRLKEK